MNEFELTTLEFSSSINDLSSSRESFNRSVDAAETAA
ncbi:MAG: hypothetical protein ACD_47C00715G0001, partial [uncultured bacterium]